MLTCLRVRSFAIIDALEVELDEGLNIVTGETGAGKSILVDALQLVLGARGRPEVVRTDAEAAEVEALFDLSDQPEALAALRDEGVETDGELLIRRVVSATGRTRAYVNGRLITLAQLREVTKGLADISSQHEYHSLADPRHHLIYLDAFASHTSLLDGGGAGPCSAHRGSRPAGRGGQRRTRQGGSGGLASFPGHRNRYVAGRARQRGEGF